MRSDHEFNAGHRIAEYSAYFIQLRATRPHPSDFGDSLELFPIGVNKHVVGFHASPFPRVNDDTPDLFKLQRRIGITRYGVR